ncbi:MAG TPA: S41 family peptidase [Steroidobacteraceae bacterium]|nr:S41 family peptidase [Steroidobacteraceae bacterium]
MSSRAHLLFGLALGLVLGVGAAVSGSVFASRKSDGGTSPAVSAIPGDAPAPVTLPWNDARLLAEVLQRVHENYVDPVGDHELLQQAVRGMVSSLDEHSTLLNRDEYSDMLVSTNGGYAGIGIEVQAVDGRIDVVRRMRGSPAEKAGIQPGDTILDIDGVQLTAADLQSAIGRMRGPVGSLVHLAVRRADRVLQFALQRDQVALQSVRAQLLAPGYGYLRVSSFSDNTATEIERSLRDLQGGGRNPAALRGLVIDLRNNPGGVLESAVQAADDFLDSGTIVSAEGRSADARFRMEAHPGDLLHAAPLVLLVNGGSASAAEILAAALHDNHRATLIGRRTYGKGTVQTIIPLSDGEALKLTTSRYYTPSGASIQGTGITPDTVLDGYEQPPGELDANDQPPTLARRDTEVGLALQTLRSR